MIAGTVAHFAQVKGPPTMRNIVPDFLEFWREAAELDRERQIGLWRERYASRHRADFVAYAWHIYPGALDAAMERFAAAAPRFASRAEAAIASIHRTHGAVLQAFDLTDSNWDWVVMVGVFSSDGWADIVNDRMTCYCAVEMIEDVANLPVLIAHETAHAAHFCVNRALMDEDVSPAADALFDEGLATFASQTLVANCDDGRALWLGRTALPDGSSVDDWLNACEASSPALRNALARDQRSTDPEIYRTYFLVRRDQALHPMRAGYYAGLRLISDLSRQYSIAEMARWPRARIRSEVAAWLA